MTFNFFRLASFIVVILAILMGPPSALAYKELTHKKMSEMAATSSVLSQSDRLNDLGLLYAIKDDNQKYPNADGDSLNINELIKFGADFEDSGARAINHFFNPLTNAPLSLASLINYTSPDWALEDKGDINGFLTFGAQRYSYKDGRGYFYKALTELAKADRDKSWGLTFQALGQVIHHIQDMAQPQHVRNDAHLDKGSVEILGLQLNPLYHPSLYEQWTADYSPASFIGYAPVYSDAQTNVFTMPRKFWTTTDGNGNAGKGIAEYTNRGFFSAGTMPDYSGGAAFPSPADSLRANTPLDIVTVCQEAVAAGRPVCPAGIAGMIRFYTTTVTDNLTGQSQDNTRALTDSIFSHDLQQSGKGPEYVQNRFTYDAAHDFLIPRAVAYSAGLINYFFRGKLEISLPDEGIYSVVDHAVENQKDTSGFRKVKLKLRNVTPGGVDPTTGQPGVEAMATSGKLVAVAKFHRNTCYQPDLSGEYGAPGMNWQPNCRSKDEEMIKSDEAAVPDGINAEAQPLTFNFQTPIPINVSDLYLQVVYRGPLGQENDAVVVATKDIAEPTFIGVYETSEQFLFGIDVLGYRTFKVWYCDNLNPELSYDECKYKYRLSMYMRFAPPTNFDPANPVATFNAVAAVEDLPVSQYGRMAVLNDLGPLSLYWMATFAYRPDSNTGTDTGVATTNQFDQQTSDLNPSLYRQARGVYVTSREYGVLTSGDVPDPPPMNPLTPLPGTVTF